MKSSLDHFPYRCGGGLYKKYAVTFECDRKLDIISTSKWTDWWNLAICIAPPLSAFFSVSFLVPSHSFLQIYSICNRNTYSTTFQTFSFCPSAPQIHLPLTACYGQPFYLWRHKRNIYFIYYNYLPCLCANHLSNVWKIIQCIISAMH